MKDLIMQFLNNQLVKIYDNMKEKNAKLALLVSVIVFVLASLANALLSQDFIVSFLPSYIIVLLKGLVTVGSFIKIALTGARTTDQLKQLETQNTKLTTPTISSEATINEILSKKTTAPAPEVGSIEETIK